VRTTVAATYQAATTASQVRSGMKIGADGGNMDNTATHTEPALATAIDAARPLTSAPQGDTALGCAPSWRAWELPGGTPWGLSGTVIITRA